MVVVAILVFAALAALAILVVSPFAYALYKFAETGFLIIKHMHDEIGTSKFFQIIFSIIAFIAICYGGKVLWDYIHKDELERERIQIQYDKLLKQEKAATASGSNASQPNF